MCWDVREDKSKRVGGGDVVCVFGLHCFSSEVLVNSLQSATSNNLIYLLLALTKYVSSRLRLV